MEIKKTNSNSNLTSTSTTEQASLTKKKIGSFVTDLKSEVTKIQWTSKEELITYSKIVVITTFVFGMAIYLMDLIIQGTLSGLHYFISLIAS